MYSDVVVYDRPRAPVARRCREGISEAACLALDTGCTLSAAVVHAERARDAFAAGEGHATVPSCIVTRAMVVQSVRPTTNPFAVRLVAWLAAKVASVTHVAVAPGRRVINSPVHPPARLWATLLKLALE